VLVEKPIDVTVERADALIEEAGRAGVTLGVIFQDRLKPDVQRLQAIVDGGELGRPILATASVKWYRPPEYYAGSTWRGRRALDGGGALMNQGVHTVDLLLRLFGPVGRVFAKTATALHDIEVEDTVVAVLEFENGALGTLEAATSAYPGYPRRIELTGSNGTLVLDGDRLDTNGWRGAPDRGAAPPPPAGAPESASSPVVSDPTAHRRVVEDFVRAVETSSAPCCDGPSGRRSVELIEAIYRSARTGEAVSLG
jgi:predicted dehydrogenase